MSRVPDFKRIVKEDFPEKYHDLIERLALPINSHIEQMRNILNKNIDFDNLAQEIFTISFMTNEQSRPIGEVKFRSKLKRNVRGMIPISLKITSSNTSFPTVYPLISFNQVEDIVYITNISGLAPETSYELTFITIN